MHLKMSTAANVSKVSLENIVSQVRMFNMAELFIKIWGGGGREGGGGGKGFSHSELVT